MYNLHKFKYMKKILLSALIIGSSVAYGYYFHQSQSKEAADENRHGEYERMTHPSQMPMQKENSAATKAGSLQEVLNPENMALQMKYQTKEEDSSDTRRRVIIDNTKSLSTGEYHYVPQMYGSIIDDDGDVVKRSKFRFAMYQLPTGHQQPLVMVCDNLIARYGGVRIDNLYYNVTQWGPSHAPTYYLRKYNIDTWELAEEIVLKDASLYSDCIAADPTTGYVYGCFRTNGVNAGSYEICLADFKNKSPYKLPALHKCTSNADRWSACAFTPDGTLYAINMEGTLLKINKTKGTGTVVGPTGIVPYNIGGAMVDPDSGKFFYYGSLADLTSAIYEINLETGEATKVLILPDGLTINGLAPVAPMPADGAPGYITDAQYSFTDGSLTGTLTFTAPTKTFGRKNLSGSLTYTVLDGEEQVAEGTVQAGQQAQVAVSVANSGLHDLCVYVSNASGRSPRNFTHKYIGNDRPARIPDVKLVYNDATGDVDLSWQPVAESENGAFFKPEEVRYRITDCLTGTVLADNHAESTYHTNIQGSAPLKNHSFRVEALFRDQVSEARESNPAVPGHLQLPFVDTFDNIEQIPDGYHVLNVAEDLNTWTTYMNGLMVHFSPLLIDMDDWLFTPPVYLEAGKMYQVSAEMASRFQSCTERIEVLWGDNNHPSAMTHTGLAAFDLVPGTGMYIKYDNYSFNLIPERTGIHYIGFHGISRADEGSILMDNLTISDAITPGTPVAVKDLTVTPGAKGAHNATIAFKAPTTNVEGNPLTSLTKVEFYRDDELVGTLTDLTPGESYSYLDVMKRGGWKEYLVVPYNEYGMGQTNRKSVFVGSYVPSPVREFTAVETENPGEVKFNWVPSNKDVYGAELTPEDLTFNLYYSFGPREELLERDVEGTELIKQICEPDTREFVIFGIRPVSATGEGSAVWSEMIPIGKPHDLPFRFSFTKADFDYSPILRRYLAETTWEVADDETFRGIAASDEDDNYAFFYASAPGEQASMLTGKIGLPEDSDVMMSLMIYNLNSEGLGANTNTLEVLASTGNGEWSSLRTIEAGQLPQEGWNKVNLPLRNFGGKGVQLQLLATCNTYPVMMIDDIRVEVNNDKDLAIESLQAPYTVRMGQDFDVSVRVRNNSASPLSDYRLKLNVNGKARLELPGEEIAEGGELTIPITMALRPDDPEECRLQAVVEFANDSHPDNNTSAEAKILNQRPGLNAPTELEAVKSPGKPVVLTWTAPAEEGNVPNSITEDFEGFTPWLANPDISPWSLYDGDKGGIGGLNSYVFPGEIKKGTQQSFWVMDDRAEGLNLTFAAYSGHQYLSQIYTADLESATFSPINCDDRLISPELYGGEQKISFYAKSYVYNLLETFEVLVSSTGNQPDDFELLDIVEQASSDWHRYEYVLPEGTRYFAIRCISYNKFMFFIDDVTCTPATDMPFLLEGYNVYRDGNKINVLPVTEPYYSDPEIPDGVDALYYVTALYNHGESVASNASSIKVNGVGSASVNHRTIEAFYSIDGRRLENPEKGVCIVKYTDGTTAKIIIR